MKVKVINLSDNKLPEYATPHSAGLDLRASLKGPLTLRPFERVIVPAGVQIELPEGYEAQIRPRSGMALKQGISILNAPGTIDADYRGEIKVLLINLSHETHEINHGDRIAQLIIAPYTKISWEESSSLTETDRDQGGYGHSGKN